MRQPFVLYLIALMAIVAPVQGAPLTLPDVEPVPTRPPTQARVEVNLPLEYTGQDKKTVRFLIQQIADEPNWHRIAILSSQELCTEQADPIVVGRYRNNTAQRNKLSSDGQKLADALMKVDGVAILIFEKKAVSVMHGLAFHWLLVGPEVIRTVRDTILGLNPSLRTELKPSISMVFTGPGPDKTWHGTVDLNRDLCPLPLAFSRKEPKLSEVNREVLSSYPAIKVMAVVSGIEEIDEAVVIGYNIYFKVNDQSKLIAVFKKIADGVSNYFEPLPTATASAPMK